MFNTRNNSGISAHPCIILYIFNVYCCFSSYQYEWKLEEAKKNILRTHTTAVSSRMLYTLAKTVSVKWSLGFCRG